MFYHKKDYKKASSKVEYFIRVINILNQFLHEAREMEPGTNFNESHGGFSVNFSDAVLCVKAFCIF